MKLSALSITFLLASNAANHIVTSAFKVGDGSSNDVMKRAVEDALLTEIKPLQETGDGEDEAAPPLRNEILGTEAPCMFDYWSRPDIHTVRETLSAIFTCHYNFHSCKDNTHCTLFHITVS